jgi:hypothetical protein
MRKLLAVCTLLGVAACASQQQTAMTDAQKKALGDSVKAVATGMVDAMNKGDMTSGYTMYSTSASARYVENGMTYPNVDAMKKMSADMGPAMESMHIALDAVDDVVLGPDAVLITSPFHMTAKVRGKPEWKGQGVWSGVFQRNGGKWEIISTHESVQHPDQMMAAMTPVPAKKGAAKPAAAPAKKPAAKSTTKKK